MTGSTLHSSPLDSPCPFHRFPLLDLPNRASCVDRWGSSPSVKVGIEKVILKIPDFPSVTCHPTRFTVYFFGVFKGTPVDAASTLCANPVVFRKPCSQSPAFLIQVQSRKNPRKPSLFRIKRDSVKIQFDSFASPLIHKTWIKNGS